jgi:hypothetical protein
VTSDDDGAVAPEHFTDDELAYLRFVRFGELPPRVAPAEWVEIVETEQPSLPSRPRHDPGRDMRYLNGTWY